MKKLIVFGLLAAALQAQTKLSGPVAVLPAADHSAAEPLILWDKNQQFWWGVIAPAGMTASVAWTLPAVDGSTGQCWGWASAFTVGWETCGAPADMMTTDTAQAVSGVKTFSANILASGTPNIGSFSNVFNEGWFGTASVESLDVFDSLQTYILGINQTSNTLFLSELSNNIVEFVPGAGTQQVRAWGSLTMTTSTDCTIGGSCFYVGFDAPPLSASTVWTLPSADGSNGQVLTTNGSRGLSWTNAGSGVTSLSATSPVVVSASTGAVTVSCSTCDTTNTNQTISGVKTFSANILASGTPNIGSSGNFFNNGYIATLNTEGIEIYFSGSNRAAIGWDSTNSAVAITNNVAQTLFEFNVGGENVSYWDLVPSSTNARNLGSASLVWNNGYFNNLNVNTTLSAGFVTTANLTAPIVASGLAPSANNTYNLGASGDNWANAWITNLFTSGIASGTVSATTFLSGAATGLTCAGLPTVSFATTGGIVTHC